VTEYYVKDEGMVGRKIADELILVPIKQNVGDLQSMYTLNEVGSRIWELVGDSLTIEQIRDVMVSEYEVSPEQVEADIREFLDQLIKIGVVTMVTTSNRKGG
jgi:hypothetical protein